MLSAMSWSGCSWLDSQLLYLVSCLILFIIFVLIDACACWYSTLSNFRSAQEVVGEQLVASLASECCTPVLWLLACSCVPDYFSEWHPSITFLCHRCRKDGLFYYVAKCGRFIKPSCIRVRDYCTCLVYRQQNFNPNWNWNCYSNRWCCYLLLHQGKVGGREEGKGSNKLVDHPWHLVTMRGNSECMQSFPLNLSQAP